MSDTELESNVSPRSPIKVEKKKRTPNAWVKHIQAYQKKHKVPYKVAMRDSKKSYHKAKKKALRKSR
jgi:hypothetical protein